MANATTCEKCQHALVEHDSITGVCDECEIEEGPCSEDALDEPTG